jgi:hypothetical protein
MKTRPEKFVILPKSAGRNRRKPSEIQKNAASQIYGTYYGRTSGIGANNPPLTPRRESSGGLRRTFSDKPLSTTLSPSRATLIGSSYLRT